MGTLILSVTVKAGRPTSSEPDTVRAEAAAASRDQGEDGGLLLLIDED